MSNTVDARGPGRPKVGVATKPSIEVLVKQHYQSKVYTSGSHVSGDVVVKCPKDTSFDSFDITFTGVAATRMDFVQSYTTNAVRTFMKLRMPRGEMDLPENRMFKAGETYSIPFHFVVPHQLTMNACNHGCQVPAVQDQHLRLPPTLGSWDGDDQAPDMTHIEYAVKARMTGIKLKPNDPKPAPVTEGKKILKVLPVADEEPPLNITAQDERYCLSKTKPMRKNILGGKTGELTVSATQPEAVMIKADGFSAESNVAKIDLEFAPSNADSAPPKISSVSGKIISTTFFGSTAADHLPNLGPKTSYSHNQVLTYSVTNNLFNTRPSGVSWSEHHMPIARRDSGYSTGGSPEDSGSEEEARARRGGKAKSKKNAIPVRHRAQLEIPIEVPVSNKKTFVPTFHNCNMSRTYTLQVVVTVGPSNTTMTLNLPIQLCVERRFEPYEDELPSFEVATAQSEEHEGDDYFMPRNMHIPNVPTHASILPGYEEHARRRVAVA